MVFFFFAVNDWRQKRGAVSCQSGGFCALFDVPRVRGRLCRSIAGAVERDWLFPRGGGGKRDEAAADGERERAQKVGGEPVVVERRRRRFFFLFFFASLSPPLTLVKKNTKCVPQ